MPIDISSLRIAPISAAVVAGLRRMAAIKARSRNPRFTSFGHIGKNYRKFPVDNLFSQFHRHYLVFLLFRRRSWWFFAWKICSFDRSIDCSIDWLFCDWLIDCSAIDWLIVLRWIDWLIDWCKFSFFFSLAVGSTIKIPTFSSASWKCFEPMTFLFDCQ